MTRLNWYLGKRKYHRTDATKTSESIWYVYLFVRKKLCHKDYTMYILSTIWWILNIKGLNRINIKLRNSQPVSLIFNKIKYKEKRAGLNSVTRYLLWAEILEVLLLSHHIISFQLEIWVFKHRGSHFKLVFSLTVIKNFDLVRNKNIVGLVPNTKVKVIEELIESSVPLKVNKWFERDR